MSSILTPSGLPGVGEVEWGAHVCHFYRDRDDLVESLVPFFKAGLEHNESCLWVTAEPFRAHDAHAALKQAVPDLDRRVKRGQIAILDHEEWYSKGGQNDPDSVIDGWLARTEQALEAGFAGLRLTGNTFWLRHDQWDDFVHYERRINETFRGQRIVGLCSYCLDHCAHDEIFDVVKNHDFALARRNGRWEQIENSSLRIAKDELHRLATELEQRVAERTAELEAALRTRDEFLSVASHELKTPVASIHLYIEGLLRASTRGSLRAEDLPQRLQRATEQCQRLDSLITRLLDVSRAGDQDLQLEPSEVDLAELVQEAAEAGIEKLSSAGCELRVQADEAIVGRWDRLRLQQVMANLLDNVANHAPGRPVDVSVTRVGAFAQVSVRDHGPGIAAPDQQRVFQRFSQTGRERSHGGFGLGLWIVKQVAQAHGGSVYLDSVPGRGACFTVSLPLSRH